MKQYGLLNRMIAYIQNIFSKISLRTQRETQMFVVSDDFKDRKYDMWR